MKDVVASRKQRSPRPPRVMSAAATPANDRPFIASAHRHAMIALGAYFSAERRGFATGGEMEDWLAAEAEVDRMLNRMPLFHLSFEVCEK